MASIQDSLDRLTKQFEGAFGGTNGSGGLLGTVLSSVAGRDKADGDSVLSRVAGEAGSELLGGPLGLIGGLVASLFRKAPEVPVFDTYLKPEAIAREYDVSTPREVGTDVTTLLPIRTDAGAGASAREAVAPVVIQVNAMDAQSFSSRSHEIAAAVKEALARSHSLRDEIWEE